MKKDVLIKIKGTQVADGDKDVVELLTTGSFCRRNKSYYIIYDESEATGFQGAKTILRYEPAECRVTMSRTGSTNSRLVIEQGRRHQCSYDTGYGSLMVGVLGSSLKSDLSDEGGSISFKYSLDINTALTSENTVDILVAEENRDRSVQS
ncbi:MAG: DUF1934 domain-containing protein [Angelakisella sp.]